MYFFILCRTEINVLCYTCFVVVHGYDETVSLGHAGVSGQGEVHALPHGHHQVLAGPPGPDAPSAVLQGLL